MLAMVKDSIGLVVPHVYPAIAEVMSRLSKSGIGKDRRNEQQNYAFRGIDDVYNALAPILADVGLCILPQVQSREVVERMSGNGKALFYVNVLVDFIFVSSKDGSSHVVTMPGEAMDSADKATNKAMSAAYKYACLQAFCIPTEGDNDTESTSHDVVAVPSIKVFAPKAGPKKPAGQEKLIGDSEIQTITHLANVAGIKLTQICDKHSIPSIDHLPMIKVGEVIQRLQELSTTEETA